MSLSSPASLLKHLESLSDPRSEKNRKHLLVDVVAIAVCGVLVGCGGPTAIRLWAEQRRVEKPDPPSGDEPIRK